MPAQWTADIIGKMHLNGLTAKQLADKLGWHPKYLSRVMNGHNTPAGAEEKVQKALNELISETSATTE